VRHRLDITLHRLNITLKVPSQLSTSAFTDVNIAKRRAFVHRNYANVDDTAFGGHGTPAGVRAAPLPSARVLRRRVRVKPLRAAAEAEPRRPWYRK
jgi:hypothetical protein